jgi:4-hydroxy-3-methylbut-2-en-1-yl diphosphate synthase IspG/GcpE
MNTEKWLGHVRQGHAIQGRWGTKLIQRQECIGIARQYLTILEIRATANKTIAPVVGRLTRDFEEATNQESEHSKQLRKFLRVYLAMLAVVLVLGLAAFWAYLELKP